MLVPVAMTEEPGNGVQPGHVAIIMDGNGRWADDRGLPRLEGHRKGADRVREITRLARRLGLQRLTLYAFSQQNWGRPAEEVHGLMTLLCDYLKNEREEILDNDIRLTAIGDLDRLPSFVREPLDALMAESQENQSMVLCLALSYGGREELVKAVQRIAKDVAEDRLTAQTIDESAIQERLMSPDVDLLVRTSGELRLSNFLLWQAAYAEFYFTDVQWPDFGEVEFTEALNAYGARNRRFGLRPEMELV